MEKKEKEIAVWNHVVQIALLMLIRLVIVLVWIALMYDKLLTNPFLAILLVLGVLAILFGGTIRFGPIKIQKKTPDCDTSSLSFDRFSIWFILEGGLGLCAHTRKKLVSSIVRIVVCVSDTSLQHVTSQSA
jgi:hypothetical protein